MNEYYWFFSFASGPSMAQYDIITDLVFMTLNYNLSLQRVMLGQLYIHVQKNEVRSLPHTIHKH